MIRRANSGDLPRLTAMYADAIADMQRKGLFIWDEVYPICYLQADLDGERLYLLEENGKLLSAFALCGENAGEHAVRWFSGENALYLDRFAVHPAYAGQGIGSEMLRNAATAAKALGAEVLRLFVVEENLPAIRLYEKNGFRRADGVYIEEIDEELSLREFGYEMKL